MADSVSLLFGSCACERNVYSIEIPSASTSSASVFFDNSLHTRRQHASPVALWLRIPLDLFHSTTIAHFPDETHSSIRRTFTSHPSPGIRRQFCGYCGTHLTAYDQTQATSSAVIDVTLGSLYDESLQELESLNILPDSSVHGEDEPSDLGDEPAEGDSISAETRIITGADQVRDAALVRRDVSSYMQNRGLPYFEEMIENSSLGRIRRKKGGRVLEDGSTSVQWEVIEFEGDEAAGDAPAVSESHVSKRVKLDREVR